MFFASDKDLKAVPKRSKGSGRKTTKQHSAAKSADHLSVAAALTQASVRKDDVGGIVEQAKVERELRVVHRELEKMALRVQAWWRGCRSRRAQAEYLFLNLNSKMSDVEKVNVVFEAKGLPRVLPPCAITSQLLHQLMFLFRHRLQRETSEKSSPNNTLLGSCKENSRVLKSKEKESETELNLLERFCKLFVLPSITHTDPDKNILVFEYSKDPLLRSFTFLFQQISAALTLLLPRFSGLQSQSYSPAPAGSVGAGAVNTLLETIYLLLGGAEPYKMQYPTTVAAVFRVARKLLGDAFSVDLREKASIEKGDVGAAGAAAAAAATTAATVNRPLPVGFECLRTIFIAGTKPMMKVRLTEEQYSSTTSAAATSKTLPGSTYMAQNVGLNVYDQLFCVGMFLVARDKESDGSRLRDFTRCIFSVPMITSLLSDSMLSIFCSWTPFESLVYLLSRQVAGSNNTVLGNTQKSDNRGATPAGSIFGMRKDVDVSGKGLASFPPELDEPIDFPPSPLDAVESEMWVLGNILSLVPHMNIDRVQGKRISAIAFRVDAGEGKKHHQGRGGAAGVIVESAERQCKQRAGGNGGAAGSYSVFYPMTEQGGLLADAVRLSDNSSSIGVNDMKTIASGCGVTYLAVVSDTLLERMLTTCARWLSVYMIPDIFRGRRGIIWQRDGSTTLNAVGVPTVLEEQLLAILSPDLLRALLSRIVSPTRLLSYVNDTKGSDACMASQATTGPKSGSDSGSGSDVEAALSMRQALAAVFVAHPCPKALIADASEVRDALASSSYAITHAALSHHQEESTWFTSKWAKKVGTSFTKSLVSGASSLFGFGASDRVVTSGGDRSNSTVDRSATAGAQVAAGGLPGLSVGEGSGFGECPALFSSFCLLYSLVLPSASMSASIDSAPGRALSALAFGSVPLPSSAVTLALAHNSLRTGEAGGYENSTTEEEAVSALARAIEEQQQQQQSAMSLADMGKRGFVHLLWSYLLMHFDLSQFAKNFRPQEALAMHDLASFGSEPASQLTGQQQAYSIVLCMVAVLRLTLIALDDSELYDEGCPIPLHEVLPLVRCLKTILYKQIISDPHCAIETNAISSSSSSAASSAGSSSHDSSAQEGSRVAFHNTVLRGRKVANMRAISSVLADFYSRWARRPFSKAALWEVEDTSPSSTSSASTKGAATAGSGLMFGRSWLKNEILQHTDVGSMIMKLMPWSLDFHERMQLLREVLDGERLAVQGSNDPLVWGSFSAAQLQQQLMQRSRGVQIKVRRSRLLEDGLHGFSKLGRMGNNLSLAGSNSSSGSSNGSSSRPGGGRAGGIGGGFGALSALLSGNGAVGGGVTPFGSDINGEGSSSLSGSGNEIPGRGTLKDRIVVRYINDFGEEEAGIDAGGLFKDFLTDLSSRIFDPSYGLFSETSAGLLYPNPSASMLYDRGELEEMYVFLGRVLGKAIFENISLQPLFAHFFLAFMHGKYNFMNLINDLATLDPELYKNLMFLKHYEGDIADLGLTFCVTDAAMGGNREVELVPGGSNLYVTSSNRHRYINLTAKYHLHDRLKEQAGAFFSGLYQVISPDILSLFCAPELQIVISGALTGIDLEDLKRHTKYTGGYLSMGDRYIARFWAVLGEFSPEDLALLLKFVTSCERPPSLGFAGLQPAFTVQRVDCRDDSRLPTASTCFNILKLPTYSSQRVLKEKLLLSIRSKSGFDLS